MDHLSDEDVAELERRAIQRLREQRAAAPPTNTVTVKPPERKTGSIAALFGKLPKDFYKAGVLAYNRSGKTQIDPAVHRSVREGPAYGSWVALRYVAFVWFQEGNWFCEVWRNKINIDNLNHTDLKALVRTVREKHGSE